MSLEVDGLAFTGRSKRIGAAVARWMAPPRGAMVANQVVANRSSGKTQVDRRFATRTRAARSSGHAVRVPRVRPASRLELMWANGVAAAAMVAVVGIVVLEVLRNLP